MAGAYREKMRDATIVCIKWQLGSCRFRLFDINGGDESSRQDCVQPEPDKYDSVVKEAF